MYRIVSLQACYILIRLRQFNSSSKELDDVSTFQVPTMRWYARIDVKQRNDIKNLETISIETLVM